MSVREIISNFKKATDKDFFEAIAEEGILLGMGLVSDELELIQKMQSDLTYEDKIDNLKNVYLKKKNIKTYNLTQKEVEGAITQSLQNCLLSLVPFRKDFRHSEWLLSDNKVKNVCQKHANTLNPLWYYMAELLDVKGTPVIKSIFIDEHMGLDTYGSKNGMSDGGQQRYRNKVYIARPGIIYVLGAKRCNKPVYHPIVWYLLDMNVLDIYLTDNFKERLKKFMEALIEKQMLIFNKKGESLFSKK